MAKIYNSDCTKGLAKNAGIQQNIDKTPNELAEKIVPTFETNPQLLRIANIVRSVSSNVSGASNIYTIPADVDFYLTGCNLAAEYDAACDNASFYLVLNIDGATSGVNPILFTHITGNAGFKQLAMNFTTPIKVNSNTNILMNGSFAAGNMRKVGTIIGYTIQNNRI